MTLVVIGRDGLIGGRLLAAAPRGTWSTSYRRDAPGPALDLATPEAFDYSRVQPGDLVVIAAAIASPDRCAREPEQALRINVRGTATVARAVAARGARVVLFSSDTVYGEANAPVDETGAVRPVGEYAHLKRAMEEAVADLEQVRILRLSFVTHRKDSFLDYLASCVERDVEAEVFDPFDRCPVDVQDVVETVLALGERWDRVPGRIVNVGGPALLSRIQMADVARRTVMPALRYRVLSAPSGFFANRPARITMLSPLLPAILGRPQRSYDEVLIREWQDAGAALRQ